MNRLRIAVTLIPALLGSSTGCYSTTVVPARMRQDLVTSFQSEERRDESFPDGLESRRSRRFHLEIDSGLHFNIDRVSSPFHTSLQGDQISLNGSDTSVTYYSFDPNEEGRFRWYNRRRTSIVAGLITFVILLVPATGFLIYSAI